MIKGRGSQNALAEEEDVAAIPKKQIFSGGERWPDHELANNRYRMSFNKRRCNYVSAVAL